MLTLIEIILISCLFRYLISLWDYSGYQNPPMYGDFEAQRHWMEITVNLPIKSWYRNELPYNDLNYWGLDYPPLTAYISYIFGHIALYIYPDLVTLIQSHGHESINGKLFMRSSVIVCDLFIFIPSILLLLNAMYLKPTAVTNAKNRLFLSRCETFPHETSSSSNRKQGSTKKDNDNDDDDDYNMNNMLTSASNIVDTATSTTPSSSSSSTSSSSQQAASSSSASSISTSTRRLKTINFRGHLFQLLCLCGPCLLLIDHGHFQYNGVCIGLTLLAVYFISYYDTTDNHNIHSNNNSNNDSSNKNNDSNSNNSNNHNNNSKYNMHIGDVIGSVCFTLALNFKQMTLYYAPVFFCHLLYKSLLAGGKNNCEHVTANSNNNNNNNSSITNSSNTNNGNNTNTSNTTSSVNNNDSTNSTDDTANNTITSTSKGTIYHSAMSMNTVLSSKLFHFTLIGLSVIITFMVLWVPFCLCPHHSSSISSSSSSISSSIADIHIPTSTNTSTNTDSCIISLQHILIRIFPFSRGIFEDKVANIWYLLSVLFDYRRFFLKNSNGQIGLVKYSFLLTLLMIFPVCYDLVLCHTRRYKSLIQKRITAPTIERTKDEINTSTNFDHTPILASLVTTTGAGVATKTTSSSSSTSSTAAATTGATATDGDKTSLANMAFSSLTIPTITTTTTATANTSNTTATTTRITLTIHHSATVTATRLLFSLMTCSLAFFLASFQVHEKSLLLSAVPSLLLLPLDPLLFVWYQCLTAFTLFPLLIRDGLRIPYFAAISAFLVCSYCVFGQTMDQQQQKKMKKNGDDDDNDDNHQSNSSSSSNEDSSSSDNNNSSDDTFLLMRRKITAIIQKLKKLFIFASLIGMIILHSLEILISPPPVRYPDLHAALFSLYGALNLIALYIYLVIWQVGFLHKNDNHDDDDDGSNSGESRNDMNMTDENESNKGSTSSSIGKSILNKFNKIKNQ